MRKEVTGKQKDQWKETKRKGVAKYQERRKILYAVNKGAQKKNKEVKELLDRVHKKSPVLKSKIKKVSKKESARRRKYLALIKELVKLPEHQYCFAKFPGCTLIPTEWHHGRGRIGRFLFMYLRHLCHWCHVYAEMHPEEAKEKEVSFSRLTKE